ncbi:hypothetical protein [Paraburkholderia sp. Ac-20347]|uniref:hypothetical protein n=1 Tax=Paraburkholderia sp. Ac-20347 TaxID=2703892 RepID=UPI00198243D4|nr:hypothetical protein [Paraburkholderia sp. Ac-20347]MBN3810149.1 hypothetical protein [Paraburkholderia sp. Ac-20347]
MKTRVFRFGQLTGALADMVAATNTRIESQSAELANDYDSALVYRLDGEDAAALRCISRDALYGSVVVGLRELSFSVACCLGTRVIDGRRLDVLQLRAPAWWRRIGRQIDCRELQISVSPSHVSMRLMSASKERLPTSGLACVFVLSAEDLLALGLNGDHVQA